MDTAAENTASAPDSRASDFFALLKPRVMSLVVFSGFAGMYVAPGFGDMPPLLEYGGLPSPSRSS